MAKLPQRSTRQAFEFLRDLYALRSWDNLVEHLVAAIPSLIPTDICSYNEMNSRRRHAVYKMWPENRPSIPDAPEILGRYSHQHPVVTHIERTKDFTCRKITNFLSQRQFRETALFNELYRPLKIPYNLGAGLALNSDCLVAIGLNRDRDFTADEIATLELLRPHIVQAFGNAEAVTRMRDELSALKQLIDKMNRAVLAFSSLGKIQWATPRAHHLMVEYGLQGSRQSDWLPTTLKDWIKQYLAKLDSSSDLAEPLEPMIIDRKERTLTIRLVCDGAKRLLFLDETNTALSPKYLTPLGLSPRETEILHYVLQGKTNPEIGIILAISPRTVQKHLERIYKRLGVENRHAAMSVAMEAARQGGNI